MRPTRDHPRPGTSVANTASWPQDPHTFPARPAAAQTNPERTGAPGRGCTPGTSNPDVPTNLRHTLSCNQQGWPSVEVGQALGRHPRCGLDQQRHYRRLPVMQRRRPRPRVDVRRQRPRLRRHRSRQLVLEVGQPAFEPGGARSGCHVRHGCLGVRQDRVRIRLTEACLGVATDL